MSQQWRIRKKSLYPDGNPDRHQNLFICSLAHCHPSLKISCKSVRKFLRKVLTNRQTDEQTTTKTFSLAEVISFSVEKHFQTTRLLQDCHTDWQLMKQYTACSVSLLSFRDMDVKIVEDDCTKLADFYHTHRRGWTRLISECKHFKHHI